MTLATSGSISIGGSTVGRSINLELGRSATATSSLGEAALRSLAKDTSGAISMSTFRGKSNALDIQTVTVGYAAASLYTTGGYGAFSTSYNGNTPNVGSISDGTFNPISNKPIAALYWDAMSNRVRFELLTYTSAAPNSGWTNMNIAGTNFSRASATYIAGNNLSNGKTVWNWTASNPFGTTTGAQKVVTFT